MKTRLFKFIVRWFMGVAFVGAIYYFPKIVAIALLISFILTMGLFGVLFIVEIALQPDDEERSLVLKRNRTLFVGPDGKLKTIYYLNESV